MPQTSDDVLEILRVDPSRIKDLLLCELTVSVDKDPRKTTCNQITFTVNYTPSALVFLKGGTVPPRKVTVRILDDSKPDEPTDMMLYMPGGGGAKTVTYGFPMPDDATWTPDFSNAMTVIVDPDNQIAERNETNNSVKCIGICVG